jgi:hypothetical protein
MIVRLSPIQSRIAALALCAAALSVLVAMLFWPAIVALQDRWDAAKILGRQFELTRDLASTAKSRAEALAALKSSPEIQVAAYRAVSPALAGAQLQGALTQLVQSSGATMNAAQILPDSAIFGATQVTVALNVTGSIAAQIKLLQDIQAARPTLRVVKYSLRDPDGEWAVASQQQSPNALQAEISVAAFMIGE